MKRTLLAMLLALPALASCGPDAQAQCSVLGGPCFRLFAGIHHHGPLYNYGPYAGYYPFAPYGPWDSNLNYTGPYPGQQAACGGLCGRGGLGGCGAGGCGAGGCGTGGCGGGAGGLGGLFTGLHARGGESSCSTCGGGGLGAYSAATFRNVFLRLHPLSHRGKVATGCSAGNCSSVGRGTPVKAHGTGGRIASVSGAESLDPVSLVAAIEAPSESRYVRER